MNAVKSVQELACFPARETQTATILHPLVLIVFLITFSLGAGAQLGCNMTITGDVTASSACGPLPSCVCECTGNMRSISVKFVGEGIVDLNVWNKSNHQILIDSFTGVQNDDILFINPNGILDGNDFEANTFFEIVDGDEVGIPTSCNQDIAGVRFGDWLVVGYHDGQGVLCDASNCLEECDCDGILSDLTVRYDGPSGVEVNVWNKANHQTLIANYSSLNTGDIIYILPDMLPGNNFEPDTFFEIVGGDEVSLNTSCSLNPMGEIFGDFTVVSYTDGSGTSCTSYGRGEIDLTINGAQEPVSILWSHGPTTEDVSNLAEGNYTVTVTDAGNCTITQTYFVGLNALEVAIDGFIADSTECAVVLPNVCDCQCDGNLSTMKLLYSGDDGADIHVWNNAAHETLILEMLGVEDGDTLFIDATGVMPGDLLADETCVEIVGGEQVSFVTSCATGMHDKRLGSFTLVGYEDGNGASCDMSDCILDCACNGKVASVTLQYIGFDEVDVNFWSDVDHTVLINHYEGVNYGDMLYADAFGLLPGDKFGTNLYVEIVGSTQVLLHTSCSIDAIDAIIGQFRVINYSDGFGAECNPLSCTGAIDVTVLSGEPPFSFRWSNGATTEDLAGVCPGVYWVTVYDANGCTQTLTYDLRCYCTGNDGSVCNEIISSDENLICQTPSNFQEAVLLCNSIDGALAGATPSPEAGSDALTGEDRWYAFYAATPGVSIKVDSEDFDIIIELQDRANNVIDIENVVDGIGGEALNIGSLTEGEIYLVAVRAKDGYEGNGDFTLCIQVLPDTRCDYGYGPWDLCDWFKADWVCSDGYHFYFTAQSDGAEFDYFPDYFPPDYIEFVDVVGLAWEEVYTLEIDAVYYVEDGNGVEEEIDVINNEPCEVLMDIMPISSVRDDHTCAEHGPHWLGDYIGTFPWVCAANDWTWEFTRTDIPELPITYSTGSFYNWCHLSAVPGLVPGGQYDVRVKPEFSNGSPSYYGESKCISIIGPVVAPQVGPISGENDVAKKTFDSFSTHEMLDLELKTYSEQFAQELENVIAVYPNPNTTGNVRIEMTNVDAPVQVDVINMLGELVHSRVLIPSAGKLDAMMTLPSNISTGMYMLEMTSGDEKWIEKLILR